MAKNVQFRSSPLTFDIVLTHLILLYFVSFLRLSLSSSTSLSSFFLFTSHSHPPYLCPFFSLTHFSLNADREPAILASCLSFRTGKFQALSLWHCFLQREVTNSNTTRSFARADNLEYHRSFWVMIITKLTTPVSE